MNFLSFQGISYKTTRYNEKDIDVVRKNLRPIDEGYNSMDQDPCNHALLPKLTGISFEKVAEIGIVRILKW